MDSTKKVVGGVGSIVHGNISEGTMTILKGTTQITLSTVKVVDSSVTNVGSHVGEVAILGVGAALDLGGAAFNDLIDAAIASGDIVTQAIGSLVGKFMKFKEEFIAVLEDPNKLLDPKFALGILKKFPVIGDIINIGEKAYKLGDRAINGEKERCYRGGMELRKFKHNSKDCAAPGNLINKSCILPCSPGKSPAALFCM